MIDTHCHLNILVKGFSQKDAKHNPLTQQDLDACIFFIEQAKKKNVTTLINVGTNESESLQCIQLAETFSNCFATLGLHPNDTANDYNQVINQFKKILETNNNAKIVGIGECGIDKHYPNYDLKIQEAAFREQIELAIKYNKALVVHSRDADQETYEILASYKNSSNFKGVIHCFSSNLEYAEKYIDLGFVLGFGGTITYPKNDTLRLVAQSIPLEKIVLETDTPFLPPQSLRGTKNNPANIAIIAEYLAGLLNKSIEEIDTVTSKAARQLFNIRNE